MLSTLVIGRKFMLPAAAALMMAVTPLTMSAQTADEQNSMADSQMAMPMAAVAVAPAAPNALVAVTQESCFPSVECPITMRIDQGWLIDVGGPNLHFEPTNED
jgi:hypothetical protein